MSEVTIAIMGATGSGKTTFVNLASGSNLLVDAGLQSCTSRVQVSPPFELDGRPISLIDTPGFDDTSRSDMDILRMIGEFLSRTYRDGKTLSGVIYMHRISDFRVGGISRRNFKMFRELCGERTLVNVVIVTNMWGEVNKELGEAREAELTSQDIFFKPTLEKGARLLRHDATRDSAHEILRCIMRNHPLPLLIQQEIVEQAKSIAETASGIELKNELLVAEEESHREQLMKVQQEAQEAIRLREEENQQKLEMEAKKQEEDRRRIEAEAQQLAAELQRQRRATERSMREAAKRARREAERAEAEFRQREQELQEEIERAEEERARTNAELQRQLQEADSDSDDGFCALM